MRSFQTTPPRLRKTAGTSNLYNNEQAYILITDAVTQRVREQLDVERRERRGLYLSLFGVGLTALIAIGGYVSSVVIESAVRAQFETAQEGFISQVEFLQRSTSLSVNLTRIDLANSYTEEEIEGPLQEFLILNSAYASEAGGSTVLTREVITENRAALRTSFDVLIRNLGQTGEFGRMERLLSQAPGYGELSDIAIQTLTQAYGRRVIGAAGAPPSWQVAEAEASTYQIYRRYSDLALKNGFPELYLAHEPLVWMIEGRAESEIDQLVADIDDLNDPDKENYMNILARLATQGFTSRENAESRRIADRATEFIEKYQDRSEAVGAVAFAIAQ